VPRTFRLPSVVIAVLLAAGVGFLLRGEMPWGNVPLSVEEGVVVLHDKASGFMSFDGDDGTQFAFHVESIVWSADGQEGEGLPAPCLREGKKVLAQVGYRWVELPGGGARPFPLWLAC
jgi:hypothetical protein